MLKRIVKGLKWFFTPALSEDKKAINRKPRFAHVKPMKQNEYNTRITPADTMGSEVYTNLVKQMEEMAASLGGELRPPTLSWKFSWIAALFGFQQAKRAQVVLSRIKWSLERSWDKVMFQMEGRTVEDGLLKG